MNEIFSTKAIAMREGFLAGIPIALGYFAVSFALGITARGIGMNALEAGVMSVGMLASAGEFAAMQLIGAGAGALEMIITTIIVNLRYCLMGAALSQRLDEHIPLRHRMLVSYCITDEIFGVSIGREGPLEPFFVYGCALISAFGWTLGTVLGVLMGNILPPWLVNALGVALYGMFLAIIIPTARKNHFIAALVALSMVCSLVFDLLPVLSSISDGFKVIILTLLLSGGAAWIHPIHEEAAQ